MNSVKVEFIIKLWVLVKLKANSEILCLRLPFGGRSSSWQPLIVFDA